MSTFLYLFIPVVLSTIIWPINRKVMLAGGRGDVYGFWISLFAALTGGLLTFIFRQNILVPSLWTVGALIGFAFAIGYCIIVNYCLKIGPTGPTVALNNMGLIGPVVVGLLWPKTQTLTAPLLIGIMLVIAAIVGFSLSPSGSEHKTVTRRWAILAVLGWVLAAASMTGQYLGSVLNPTLSMAQVTTLSVVSMLILLPFVIRRGKSWFNKSELIGGIMNGVIQAVGLYFTQQALQHISSKIVFPVTVLIPLILVLLLSGLFYKEKLSRLIWISSGIGVIGLVFLSVFR